MSVCENNIVKTIKPNLLEWAQKNKVPSDLGEATLTEFLVDFVAYCALKLQLVVFFFSFSSSSFGGADHGSINS